MDISELKTDTVQAISEAYRVTAEDLVDGLSAANWKALHDSHVESSKKTITALCESIDEREHNFRRLGYAQAIGFHQYGVRWGFIDDELRQKLLEQAETELDYHNEI